MMDKTAIQSLEVAKPKHTATAKWLALMGLILVLALLIIPSVFFHRQYQKAIVTLSQYQNLQESQAAQIHQLQQQWSQQQQMIGDLKQEMQILNQQSAALSAKYHFDLLSALLFAQEADFALQFLKNKPAAMELLKRAQGSITHSDHAKIRATIDSLIAQLNNVSSVDDASIMAQLNNLQILALQLPLVDITAHKITFHYPMNHVISWNEFWQSLKQVFASLVTVRQTENRELFTPEARQLAINVLQLLNVQAQTAVISHDQTLFQSSLKQMQTILQQYYAGNPSLAVTYLNQNLQQLLQTHIDPDFPDLSGLIQSLQSALNASSTGENLRNTDKENASSVRQTAPVKTQALPS